VLRIAVIVAGRLTPVKSRGGPILDASPRTGVTRPPGEPGTAPDTLDAGPDREGSGI